MTLQLTNTEELEPSQILWEHWAMEKFQHGIDVTGEVGDKVMEIINTKREGFTAKLLNKALDEVMKNV